MRPHVCVCASTEKKGKGERESALLRIGVGGVCEGGGDQEKGKRGGVCDAAGQEEEENRKRPKRRVVAVFLWGGVVEGARRKREEKPVGSWVLRKVARDRGCREKTGEGDRGGAPTSVCVVQAKRARAVASARRVAATCHVARVLGVQHQGGKTSEGQRAACRVLFCVCVCEKGRVRKYCSVIICASSPRLPAKKCRGFHHRALIIMMMINQPVADRMRGSG